MQNYIYLIIHILFALGMFISLKLINIKKVNIYKAISLNYFIAALFTLFDLSINHPEWIYSAKMVLPSLIVALLFTVSFILMSYSTVKVGIGLTTALNKMSVLIPVSVGVIYLGQTDALALKLIGIAISISSIFLILYKKSDKRAKGVFILPFMVFVSAGMIDTSMELAHTYVISEVYENEVFLFSVFSIAVIFSLIALGVNSILTRKRGVQSFKEKEVSEKKAILRMFMYGSMLGVFNFLTSKMILINVGNLGGSVVYPIHNASVVVFTTIIGLFFFKESFTKKQWIGVILAVIGVSFIASTL